MVTQEEGELLSAMILFAIRAKGSYTQSPPEELHDRREDTAEDRNIAYVDKRICMINLLSRPTPADPPIRRAAASRMRPAYLVAHEQVQPILSSATRYSGWCVQARRAYYPSMHNGVAKMHG